MGFEKLESELQDIVNSISLASAVIVFSTWSVIGIIRSNLLNRVTLYFQILIAFIDIIRHLSKYFLNVQNESVCEIAGTLVNYTNHLYIAFNVLLATNAHLIFILRQRPKMSFYPLYTLVLLMYIGIINFSYYTNGAYGRNFYGQCSFKVVDNLPILKLYIIYLMEAPGVLYCGYVVFLVLLKFNDRMSKLRIVRNEEYINLDYESYEPVDHIGKLYWRVSIYPISCFFTFFPYLIGMLMYDFGLEPPMWFSFFYRLCSRLPGTTNLFFMLYDSNFQLALKEFFNYIKFKFTKKCKGKETYELGEHTQSNQANGQFNENQFGRHEDWKIEFDDGYTMTVQDHIKYL